ncbi:uncharacterized protein LOC128681619 [Plodia interpunctella]|uniref:uncharacterized protein LOC128681619 n=1 Tax=Plodia interpunctella TaxID=58824 RepID=UPI0023676651|nr:uncharacterized protein LOC128681619 isoform X2 [Plodia interpunctella]
MISNMKMICLFLLVVFCGAFAQEGLLQKLNVENQLCKGLLCLQTRPPAPSYQTMVIYNEIMRKYYDVVKRYYEYKNRNMSTVGIQNPEFRYFEEMLSKLSSSELRVLMSQFGQGGLFGT